MFVSTPLLGECSPLQIATIGRVLAHLYLKGWASTHPFVFKRLGKYSPICCEKVGRVLAHLYRNHWVSTHHTQKLAS